MSSFVYLYSLYVHMFKLYLSVFERLLSVFIVCTKGLRVTQFQFSVCVYCTCGRIDNKADLTWLELQQWEGGVTVMHINYS